MPTTVLPEAVRDSFGIGRPGDANPTPLHLNAGTPRTVGFHMVSAPGAAGWDQAGLTWTMQHWRSYDGGMTWADMSPDTFTSGGPISKLGDNRPASGVSWDGRAVDIRVAFTCSQPFSWGIDLL